MALNRRYHTWPPGEVGYLGMDFTAVMPIGFGIVSSELEILTNTDPANPTTDFAQAATEHIGRRVWCWVSGGSPGHDYQFRWTAADNQGHVWQRTGLLLCAETS